MAKKRGKKVTTATKKSETLIDEAIASALSSVNAVLMKVCRLCETKDGPFLNIFDADSLTAKKIEELMPFVVAENDDLPHKICFRCSAKVEELYEFIQKCVNTQHNLHKNTGKQGPLPKKTKQRAHWEDKLTKSTLSNDIICDALIKKAMESMKDVPINSKLLEDNVTQSSERDKNKIETEDKNTENTRVDSNGAEKQMKNLKLAIEKVDQKVSLGSNNNDKSLDNMDNGKSKRTRSQKDLKQKTSDLKTQVETIKDLDTTKIAISAESPKNEEPEKQKETPFNIMDHVSKIKVNGVGILFQCKLCNKNFLKIEVVESHGCAKNGVPKMDFAKHIPQPQPPKPPTIKYIKIDNTTKKSKEQVTNNCSKTSDPNKTKKEELPQPTANPPLKPKPKIGPASKVKRQSSPKPDKVESTLTNNSLNSQINQAPAFPVMTFPTLPKLNSRYSFVMGPNNTLTLMEEPSNNPTVGTVSISSVVPTPSISTPSTNTSTVSIDIPEKVSPKKPYTPGPKSKKIQKLPSPEIIDLDDSDQTPSGQPYPVGLFKTGNSTDNVPPPNALPAFATPAMKKQLYTVVQTGNPSKLLISSKPVPTVEEPPKKRVKKSKNEVKETNDQPYKITIEDATPAKDQGMFTFINVDPLLQPSYVLPTDSIQESKISTSTQAVSASNKKDKDNPNKIYSCNMCDESFTREKKLLSHIQSHYTKMDEEDHLRELSKKRKTKTIKVK